MYTVWRDRANVPEIASTPIASLDAVPTSSGSGTTPVAPPAAADSRQSHVRDTPSAVTAPSYVAQEHPRAAVSAVRSAATVAAQEGVGVYPYLLFRSTALGDTYGRVSVTSLDAPDGRRYVSPLQCDRVHFAAGRGLCLEAKRGVVTTYRAHIFDREFRILNTVPLGGIPSRARLSLDGRRAAMTVFVSGHSYAGSDFSTRTSVVDAVSGEVLVADLEEFNVSRDGAPFKAADFNFWGVTFTRDPNRFYATLASAGEFYLIEGDLGARTARVVHRSVECPSLSPDNTRVAFKRRMSSADGLGRFAWRLYVLELATGVETGLEGETRSVDDQVEWLGNDQIIYSLPDSTANATAGTDTWALAIKAHATPRLLVAQSFSPAVLSAEAVPALAGAQLGVAAQKP